MFDHFTDRARNALHLANLEASRSNQVAVLVHTEHVLMGVLRVGGVAIRVLERMNIDPQRIRTEIARMPRRDPLPMPMPGVALAPRAIRVLELAVEESQWLGDDYVGTEHLLLGLLRESVGIPARPLVKVGARTEPAHEALFALRGMSVRYEDRVRRAHGILKHARWIKPHEAIDLLARVRHGVAQGLLSEVDLKTLDPLLGYLHQDQQPVPGEEPEWTLARHIRLHLGNAADRDSRDETPGGGPGAHS